MPDSEPVKDNQPKGDEALLKQIRDDYRYCLDYWRDNRDQAATDMRFVSGDHWEKKDRDFREEKGLPVLSPDELSQYLKQANNSNRQNKIAVKVVPKGSGATDQDAERRASIIRAIEYRSNAQAAYTTAFEQATSCGFGAFRLNLAYVAENGEHLEPRIRRIPNQFTVLLDPDAKEADFSDMEICFVTDIIRKSTFARKYPKAQKKSFNAEDATMAPDWFRGENIVIAEYWKRDVIDRDRTANAKVTQYITNGVEILEQNEWVGSWIPVVPILGEELYVNEGGASKRMFMSLIRRARVPQMMLAYIASQEATEFAMAPKAPLFLYEGQEQADEDALTSLNNEPRAFVKIRATTEHTGAEVLPMPTRPQFTPNTQAYEVARESWRRAIQAAIGIAPLPSAAQRQNEKSGIALEKIQTAEAIGSFHFTDNFRRGVENCGRQLNQLITKVMTSPRHVAVRNPDDSHALLHVTTSQHLDPQAQQQDVLVADRGEFDVTISTGPSYQSQREEAAAFADLLVQNIQTLPIPDVQKAALLSLAVKMKAVGPIGDEIAKILDPQGDGEPLPPQAQAALAKAQQQTQAIDAFAKQLQQEIQKLQLEKHGKVIENQTKLTIATMQRDLEIAKLDNQRAIAEIQTKAQIATERASQLQEVEMELHGSAHDIAMQKDQQAHEQDMAQQQAQVAQAQQATDIAAQQQQQQAAQEQQAQS